MYLLDTNVISELRKARLGKANKNVITWASSIPTASLYISAISILELEMGILLVERRNTQQGQILRQWLEQQVIPAFAERTLPLDTVVALECAKLHVPDPRSDRDALIAATALAHGLMVATRYVDDFKPTGVEILNPWEA